MWSATVELCVFCMRPKLWSSFYQMKNESLWNWHRILSIASIDAITSLDKMCCDKCGLLKMILYVTIGHWLPYILSHFWFIFIFLCLLIIILWVKLKMTNDSYLFHIFMDILLSWIISSVEYMDPFHAKGIYLLRFQIDNIKWNNKEIFDNLTLV